MSDDQNTTQNQDSVENSIPASPQEPMADAPIPPIDSEPAEVPSDAPESSPNDFLVKSNDIPPSDSTPTEVVNEQKTEEKQAEIPVESMDIQTDPAPNGTSEPILEPIPDPVETIEPVDSTSSTSPEQESPPSETPQIPVNEPLEIEPEIQENEIEQPKEEQIETKTPEPAKAEIKSEELKTPEPKKEEPKISYLKSQKWGELLAKAKNAIQFRKRKKLDKIMVLFLKHSKITNDEVEKFLHVSDATATRYLSQLKKEGKIKQNGKTGKAVSYSRI